MRKGISIVLVGLLGACVPGPGAEARDAFFPGVGDSTYEALHYDVGLSYAPRGGEIDAMVRVRARAIGALRHFFFDLNGLRVTGVTINGARARFSHREGRLTVIPATLIEAGERFEAVIRYRGRPHHVIDPDGSVEGWVRTEDGAAALGQPIGTATWLPCNNALQDKASFSFRITVPERLKGVANGRLVTVRHRGGTKTFVWREAQPMAPYLAVIDIGRGRLVRGQIAGLPAWTLVDPRLAGPSRRVLRALPEIVRFQSRVFGPYPFDALGSIVDLIPVGYEGLETQTRPIYSRVPSKTTLVHETAHQWFGDSVGLSYWSGIWLNEGFATWAAWYYVERHGGRTARRVFARLYRTPATETAFWDPPPGLPHMARNIFASSIYQRGAMTLQALRMEIGSRAMLATLRRWAAEHRYGNATTPEFVALAEEVSGQQLDNLFDDWLYFPGKPRGYRHATRGQLGSR